MRPPVVRGAACGPVGALSAGVGERSACRVRPGGCALPLVCARQREGRSPLIEPFSRQEKFQASLLQIMGGSASPVRGPADERAHNSHSFLRFHTLQQNVLGRGVTLRRGAQGRGEGCAGAREEALLREIEALKAKLAGNVAPHPHTVRPLAACPLSVRQQAACRP